jgi:hypothetical protein
LNRATKVIFALVISACFIVSAVNYPFVRADDGWWVVVNNGCDFYGSQVDDWSVAYWNYRSADSATINYNDWDLATTYAQAGFWEDSYQGEVRYEQGYTYFDSDMGSPFGMIGNVPDTDTRIELSADASTDYSILTSGYGTAFVDCWLLFEEYGSWYWLALRFDVQEPVPSYATTVYDSHDGAWFSAEHHFAWDNQLSSDTLTYQVLDISDAFTGAVYNLIDPYFGKPPDTTAYIVGVGFGVQISVDWANEINYNAVWDYLKLEYWQAA